MTKRFFLIMISSVLCVIVVTAGLFFTYILANPPYFEQFENATAVRDAVIKTFSESETSIEDVLEQIQRERFGVMRCYFFTSQGNVVDSPQASGRIDCQGQKQTLSMWFYLISFYFEDDILRDIEVDEIYLGS